MPRSSSRPARLRPPLCNRLAAWRARHLPALQALAAASGHRPLAEASAALAALVIAPDAAATVRLCLTSLETALSAVPHPLRYRDASGALEAAPAFHPSEPLVLGSALGEVMREVGP